MTTLRDMLIDFTEEVVEETQANIEVNKDFEATINMPKGTIETMVDDLISTISAKLIGN